LLRERATYRLIGAIEADMARRLTTLATTLGVRLVISGETSTADLAAAISEADIVCCLRWPTLESASASTIEAMLSSKAVIVENTGFYAELPDDCVAKIRPDNEVDDLQMVLERLDADPVERRAMAQRGAAWAADAFSPLNYAQQLVEITRDCCAANPGLDLIRSATQQLHRWGGMHHLMLLPETLQPLALFDTNTPDSQAPLPFPSEQETAS
jgi:glycosyltransferase involved in cell wall biosynthesis